MTYAKTTTVSPDKSKAEIERILRRYGADQFGYSSLTPEHGPSRAVVVFKVQGLMVRLPITLPDRNDVQFQRTPVNKNWRSPEATEAAWEQACRQRWRALVLFTKATLEAVEAGIITLDQAFLAHIILPNGQTTYEWIHPQMQLALAEGKMPTQFMLGPGNG